MSNLNSWQLLTRVLPGKPFGNGSSGAYSSATIPTLTKDSCSGTATSTTLTTSGSTFANGDVLLIHQTRGTGVGQWEINRVSSGGGSTSLTLQVALNYTYTDSGASQAQAVKIPQYTNVTCSGTWSLTTWDQNVGGIFPLAIKGTLSGSSGIINANGAGFLNATTTSGDSQASQGEGTSGAKSDSTSANGNGGGGGSESARAGGGGGGGNSSSGTTGNAGSGGVPGTGGSSAGSSDLVTMVFGGGGGGGSGANALTTGGAGGLGGGIVLLYSKTVDLASLTINAGGNNGVNGTGPNNTYHAGGGGGGGGGSVLLACETATLGTNKINTTAGSGGAGLEYSYNSYGGNGSSGRIAVHHSGTVTGTTNPSFTDVSDSRLFESGGSFIFNLL